MKGMLFRVWEIKPNMIRPNIEIFVSSFDVIYVLLFTEGS